MNFLNSCLVVFTPLKFIQAQVPVSKESNFLFNKRV
jgi:hypothetical protein